MRSAMEHSFGRAPSADIPRSSFDRTTAHKTTFDADWLVPIFVDEVLPGDTFNLSCTHFCRVGSPLVNPVMDNMYLETFWFFVPNRLLWDNWEKFMGAQDDPSDSIDFTTPKISSVTNYDNTGVTAFDQLLDYFGIQVKTGNTVNLSELQSMPLRAYNLIWNEWFRDQNLQNSVNVPTGDGPDGASVDFQLLKRGKRHDYFTSCLPWPQKGDAVGLPLTGTALVGVDNAAGGNLDITALVTAGAGPADFNTTGSTLKIGAQDTGGFPLYADLGTTTATTINDLRLAFQTQRLLERDARSGTRYVEHIHAHFGVTVPDFRVQRPEFLGGGSSAINSHVVPNTAPTDTPAREQAELAAYATSQGRHGFAKSFVEHGLIIGLANVRSDITYSQGIERYWFKDTRFDYYYPVLSQIGEQAVLNREIYYQNVTVTDQNVFGYQERYAEYRYKPSKLTGLMRPDRSTNISNWHLSEQFTSLPALGDTFIQSNTGIPLDRAITIPSEPQIIGDFYIEAVCARPMPLFGVPGNLDHF